jgi:hypothetical protein
MNGIASGKSRVGIKASKTQHGSAPANSRMNLAHFWCEAFLKAYTSGLPTF